MFVGTPATSATRNVLTVARPQYQISDEEDATSTLQSSVEPEASAQASPF
jgi:hypothetical protein